ncbi:MAG: class I SAM-dependent methyltransferase [Chitinophagales bacterium]
MEPKIGTAFMTAFIRGYHSVNDNPKIIDDQLALRLVPEEVQENLKRHLAKTAADMAPESAAECTDYESALRLGVRVMAGSILARARYVEDRLEEAVRKGVSQYVILGAGLDTFAFRRLDLSDRLQVFELDLPATQDIKRKLLGRLGLKDPDNLHFVPIDFTQESLDSALTRSGYDPEQHSFFSWMGVTHYLPMEAISVTLKAITGVSGPGSEIVFDYWDNSAFDPEQSSSRVKSLIENVKNIGEPIITGFDPLTLGLELAQLGLDLVENLGPSDIRQRYLENCGGGYTIGKHAHLACARIK